MFEKLKAALEKGEIIAIEEDKKKDQIKFGGSFATDAEAVLAYSAKDDASLACMPNVVFLKIHHLNPPYQL